MTGGNFVIKLNQYKFFFFLFSHFSIHTLSLSNSSLFSKSPFSSPSHASQLSPSEGAAEADPIGSGAAEADLNTWVRGGYGKGVGCWFRSGIGLSLVAVVSCKSQWVTARVWVVGFVVGSV